ncbi:hypothetical protein LY90DRAFT_513330 [Neocallimastix californiae]|uniref:Uncharacterized protein n=1 Tax=Neocallimastix californiae TaxID=1754190 RepID=A0A1Y2AZ43_9FUNG|nr:hypothetical protein LY90DRAFT_513330 [Neocallimastix californiae]|eukprot:ORY27849.1 hypothetical protein LY90DRAFT_513330 [Neocallimastix californiae]
MGALFWKLLYLLSIPISVFLFILVTMSSQINNKFLKKSYIYQIDYSGILIFYSFAFCIYLLNEAIFDKTWKYYLTQFSFPAMCIVFFIITELVYKKNVVLPIESNVFYFFSFCLGYNFLMDTNKLSLLIRKYNINKLIHEFSVIHYEILITVICLFSTFLIGICKAFKYICSFSPIICISLGVFIIFLNSFIFEFFNIATPTIMIITFVLLNTVAICFIITNLYIIMKEIYKNKEPIKILKNLLKYYFSGKILNLTIYNILYKQFYKEYIINYFGIFYEELELYNFKIALNYFHDIIRDVYYDTTRKCNIYLSISGLISLIIVYVAFVFYHLSFNSKLFNSFFKKLNQLNQNISEGLIKYYDSFSDNNNNHYNNNNNITDYIYRFHKNKPYNMEFYNDINYIFSSNNNNKIYKNLESGSIFNVRYPKNFIKVRNDTLYKPVLKKDNINFYNPENINTNNTNNNRNSSNGFIVDNNTNSERRSIHSFIDLRKNSSSLGLYSPIHSSINFDNKIKSPMEAHFKPFVNDIYNRLSLISSNSLPYMSDNSKRSSHLTNSYQELSNIDDNEYNETFNETDFIDDQKSTSNKLNYNNLMIDNENSANHNYFINKKNNYLNNKNNQIKISNTNPFYKMEIKKNNSLMNYSGNNVDHKISDINMQFNKSKSKKNSSDKFKNDPLFFDVSKLNKDYKEYNWKEYYLNSTQKSSSLRLPKDRSLYEKKLINNYKNFENLIC